MREHLGAERTLGGYKVGEGSFDGLQGQGGVIHEMGVFIQCPLLTQNP